MSVTLAPLPANDDFDTNMRNFNESCNILFKTYRILFGHANH